MLVRFLLFSLILFCPFSKAKIASLDLCADQWMMTFFHPDQVAFLTPLSKDPTVSYHHEKASEYKIDTPNIETLLSEDIHVVLATNHVDATLIKILESKGITLILIPTITNRKQLLKWAKKIKALTNKKSYIIQKLQSVEKKISKYNTAFYVGTSGSSPGNETLLNEAFSLSGYKNLSAYEGWGYNTIETIVAHNPDYIFTPIKPVKQRGQNNMLEKLTQATIIPVSQRYTVCSCPGAFLDLVKVLKDAKK